MHGDSRSKEFSNQCCELHPFFLYIHPPTHPPTHTHTHSLHNKLDAGRSSRETTPATQSSESPRPAEPYYSDGEGTEQEEMESDVDEDDIV